MFTKYNNEDIVLSGENVVSPMWSNNISILSPSLMNNIPNSQTDSFYWNIYNGLSLSNPNTELQFSISYGHYEGLNVNSGSIYYGYSWINSNSLVYRQYQNLIFGDENTKFTFNGTSSTDEILVINIARDRFRQKIHPSSIGLTINGNLYTDNSLINPVSEFIGSNQVYSLGLISPTGSLGMAQVDNSNRKGYVVPDLGLIVLDKVGLFGTGGTQNTILGNFLTSLKTGDGFTCQSYETVYNKYLFTRIKNQEYNYTSNPSIIDNNGNLLHISLIDNPQTYITTIGLYNDLNELIGIAKLSHPLPKDHTRELLLRVKLDW